MIRIAIVEDEEDCIKKETEIIKQYFAGQRIPYDIAVHMNVEWFLMGLKEEVCDLYILDVKMPFKNGLEAAREIRKLYPDPAIIFVTNYIDYAVEAYEVNTYRYIPKSNLGEKLLQALDSLLPKILEKEKRCYMVEKRGEIDKIPYSDIYYLKKDGKYVDLVHRGGITKLRKTLIGILQELDGKEFLPVEKSYAVNIRHVMQIKGCDLIMRDGAAVPVGTARIGKVKRKSWISGVKNMGIKLLYGFAAFLETGIGIWIFGQAFPKREKMEKGTDSASGWCFLDHIMRLFVPKLLLGDQ